MNARDIPQAPDIKGRNYYCPSCHQWLLWLDAVPNENDNYCGKCGQAIDWTETSSDSCEVIQVPIENNQFTVYEVHETNGYGSHWQLGTYLHKEDAIALKEFKEAEERKESACFRRCVRCPLGMEEIPIEELEELLIEGETVETFNMACPDRAITIDRENNLVGCEFETNAMVVGSYYYITERKVWVE